MFEFFYTKESQDKLIKEIDELFEKLFPICRSITGNGVRKTLTEIKEITDFNIEEIPSGTKCYDWIIPDEWNINEAYIMDKDGNKADAISKEGEDLLEEFGLLKEGYTTLKSSMRERADSTVGSSRNRHEGWARRGAHPPQGVGKKTAKGSIPQPTASRPVP